MSKKSTTKANSLPGEPMLARLRQNKTVERLLKIRPTTLFYVLAGIGGLLFFVTLLTAHVTRPYGSDDVVIQAIWQSWSAGQPMNAVVGTDGFLLKVPFYLLHDLIMPHNSRLKLFISILFFSAILYISIVAFLKKYFAVSGYTSRRNIFLAFLPFLCYFGITALPLPNSTFVDISWVTNFMKINLRNAELGIALLLILAWTWLLQQKFSHRRRKHVVLVVLITLFASLFLYSDPYFVYTLGAGALLALVVAWATKQLTLRQTLLPLGLFAASYLGTKVIAAICDYVHFTSPQVNSFRFVSAQSMLTSLQNTNESVFKMFNANFWGLPLGHGGMRYTALLLNSLLVILAVAAFVYTVRRLRQRQDFLRLTLVTTIITTLCAYGLTMSGTDPTVSRYIILAVICSLPLISDALVAIGASIKYERIFYIVIAGLFVSLAFNSVVNLQLLRTSYVASDTQKPNAINYQIIDTIKKQGLTKGYTDYWDGPINTYFSDRDVIANPITCASGQIKKYYWLYNFSDNTMVPAKRTFFLTTHEVLGNSNGYCGELLGGFGKPAKVIRINQSYTLYVYNKDIGPLMPIDGQN